MMRGDHEAHRRRFARRREAASDADLMAAIGRGDHAALAAVYAREGSRVLAAAEAVAGPSRAEDVTQEVMVALWRRPERFDPTRGTLRSFLLLQARSRATDAIRSDGSRAARERSVGTRDAARQRSRGSHLEDEVMGRITGDAVQRALECVPHRERDAIALAFFGGRTYREVAASLGRPEGTVKGQIRSGLARLASQLADQVRPAGDSPESVEPILRQASEA